MRQRSLVLSVLALLALAGAVCAAPAPAVPAAPAPAVQGAPSAPEAPALDGLLMPQPVWRTNCEYSLQYCNNNCFGDSQCELGCTCSYYSCKGMDLPNECIY